MGVSMNRAQYFLATVENGANRRDYQPTRIKQLILAQGKSKYRPNFSPQISLF
jgi:hypothetical protein